MRHQTLERFQGMWLGGIVGQALANQNKSCDRTGIFDFPHQNWLAERRQIAEILLRSERLGVDDIGQQLAIQHSESNATVQNCLRKVDEPAVNSQFFSGYNYNSRQADAHSRVAEIKLSTCGDNILSLLSLIIFYGDNQDLLKKIIDQHNQHNLKLANSGENAEIKEDILIWSYLLTSVLNNKLESWQINFNWVVERILNNLEGKETLLINKLKLVVQAVKSGISLHQLLDEMSSNGSTRQTAIALSWYCFVTTPNDFKISVQRAASIKPNIAELTATLTGTFSGAYNGMTVIPYNWRIRMSQNPNYSSENQLVSKLFKTWLGIYSIDSNQESYNQELYAVASPQMIQPRQTLKIISQKSRFRGI